VKHIEDVREIGLVTPEMLILQEDPKHNRFVDITDAVRRLKCRSIYGYYEDGWIDERAEIQVMAGASGVITMNFYYPGEVTDDQWMMIYVNGEPHLSLQFESQQAGTAIEVRPYETVTLRFEPNFWCREATEQRGERRMAAVLALTAD